MKPQPASERPAAERDTRALAARFAEVRKRTLALAKPLSPEDAVVQSMPDASPAKWHLAHTTWFFETFILAPFKAGYRVFDPAFGFLFNSYYEALGDRHARPERGQLTRPTLVEVMQYRAAVNEAVAALIAEGDNHRASGKIAALATLGCHHEEQHQELLLTDIKHLFSQNPLRPAYANAPPATNRSAPKLSFVPYPEGVYEIGNDGKAGFAFDCEGPRHKVYLYPFALASRLSTNGEYLAFVKDGGYRRSELWLSDGWAWAQKEKPDHPLYWRQDGGGYREFTLHGERALNPAEPVCHLSYYEADAFARWAGCRLPREEELEIAYANGAADAPPNTAGTGRLHPGVAPETPGLAQTAGEAWAWTASSFSPYPAFKPSEGAVGEYNGKFMANQLVLKGASCATADEHSRPSYRNFFYPTAQWQFTGVRLAKDP